MRVTAGWAADRGARRHPTDAVPARAARDRQDDTCPGGRRAVPPAAVRRRHQPPQPGQHDTEAETARCHGPRSRRVNIGLYGAYKYDSTALRPLHDRSTLRLACCGLQGGI